MKKDDDWYLKEWVNFFDMDSGEMSKMVNMGYATMLAAASQRDGYEAVIGDHAFERKDIDGLEYIRSLIRPGQFTGKSSMTKKIDKARFESEIGSLNFKVTHQQEFASA